MKSIKTKEEVLKYLKASTNRAFKNAKARPSDNIAFRHALAIEDLYNITASKTLGNEGADIIEKARFHESRTRGPNYKIA